MKGPKSCPVEPAIFEAEGRIENFDFSLLSPGSTYSQAKGGVVSSGYQLMVPLSFPWVEPNVLALEGSEMKADPLCQEPVVSRF